MRGNCAGKEHVRSWKGISEGKEKYRVKKGFKKYMYFSKAGEAGE